jgi:hypothetical protein
MHKRFFWILAGIALIGLPAYGSAGKNALIFDLNAALKGGDVIALARCFNVLGTDEATRLSTTKILDEIIRWPAPSVTVTEREGNGRAVFERNGRNFTLNGDWTFQVHIHRKDRPDSGYVFPAGYSNQECLILLAVPDKPKP